MIDTQNAREARRQFPLALVAGVVIVGIVAVILIFVSKSAHVAAPTQAKPMAFGPQEQAYASNISYTNIQLAKSENFLNQQFMYINGTVSNAGDRTITQLQITVNFYDDVDNKHLTMHDAETAIAVTDPPLSPHQQRKFSLTIDGYPQNWNQQMPAFHTSGLVLQ
ncbi:MAG TPA: FxLYD domain-containing protein [Candidatus Acidoferrales bacterium]